MNVLIGEKKMTLICLRGGEPTDYNGHCSLHLFVSIVCLVRFLKKKIVMLVLGRDDLRLAHLQVRSLVEQVRLA